MPLYTLWASPTERKGPTGTREEQLASGNGEPGPGKRRCSWPRSLLTSEVAGAYTTLASGFPFGVCLLSFSYLSLSMFLNKNWQWHYVRHFTLVTYTVTWQKGREMNPAVLPCFLTLENFSWWNCRTSHMIALVRGTFKSPATDWNCNM